jgi:hypothetical protein
LRFGLFDCKKYVKKCKTLGITSGVEFKFYGKVNKWPELSKFFYETSDEVNQEDHLISVLNKPGNLLVLFKVSEENSFLNSVFAIIFIC